MSYERCASPKELSGSRRKSSFGPLFFSKDASLDLMENTNEPTEGVSPVDPDAEKPFPLTTAWFELQSQEASENSRRKKVEREQARAKSGRTKGRKCGFLRRWWSWRPS